MVPMAPSRSKLDRTLPPLRAGEQRHGDDDADEAAVEAHAAVPERDDVGGVRGVVGQIVEQHVADAAAEHDADHRPEGEIPDGGGGKGGLSLAQRVSRVSRRRGVPGAEEDAGEVAQRVPADGERAEREGDRADIGKGHAATWRCDLAGRPLWSSRARRPK